MKKSLVLFVLLVLFTSLGFSDLYIKEKYNAGTLGSKGISNLGNDTFSEYWIGQNKIAAITKNRILIIDRIMKKIYFIFPTTKTYVESSFPMDPQNLRSSEVANILARLQFNMEVTPTNETKKIRTHNCKKYIINNWVVDRGTRKGEVKRTVWITTDVSFDLDLYWDVVTSLLKLVSDSPEFFEELNKTKGLTLESDSVRDLQGLPITTKQEVVEMIEKKAPAGIYNIPKGYIKQASLAVPDLLTLLKD